MIKTKRRRTRYSNTSKQFRKQIETNVEGLAEKIMETSVESLGILQNETPVDTGLMKSSEHKRNYTKQDGKYFYRVYSPVFYTIFVHEGTIYQDANPYLERAFYQTKDLIDKLIEDTKK